MNAPQDLRTSEQSMLKRELSITIIRGFQGQFFRFLGLSMAGQSLVVAGDSSVSAENTLLRFVGVCCGLVWS
jgi:hypothetical protein